MKEGNQKVSEVKQVILMRTDLNMRKGKMIAQGAHASMKVLLDHSHLDQFIGGPVLSVIEHWPELTQWLKEGFTKVCLKVESKEQLLELVRQATRVNLPTAVVVDSGRTEFHGVPTITCAAIGPAKSEDIDNITGELQLL